MDDPFDHPSSKSELRGRRLAKSTLGKFVLPEETLSLKILFDNARNYLICGALVAFATALARGKVPTLPWMDGQISTFGSKSLAWVALAMALVLSLLNLFQSFLIYRRLSLDVELRLVESSPKVPSPRSKVLNPFLFVVTGVGLLAMLCFSMWFMYAGVRIAIYLIWSAASAAN